MERIQKIGYKDRLALWLHRKAFRMASPPMQTIIRASLRPRVNKSYIRDFQKSLSYLEEDVVMRVIRKPHLRLVH